jgi:DNA-binding NarL/FixJ family response regulator
MSTLKDTNIVIVEVESMARFGLLQLINKEPKLRVCGEAICLVGARELCEKHQPQVVVLDVAVGDGVNFIKDLPRWSPGTRVVVHTGALEVILIQRAFKAGALGYVSRHDSTGCLLKAIRSAVEGGRHMGQRVSDLMLGNLANGAIEVRADGMPLVSNREAQVLRMLGKGLSNRQISDDMQISIKTIETHCQRLKEKLHVSSSCALRQYAAVHAGALA